MDAGGGSTLHCATSCMYWTFVNCRSSAHGVHSHCHLAMTPGSRTILNRDPPDTHLAAGSASGGPTPSPDAASASPCIGSGFTY